MLVYSLFDSIHHFNSMYSMSLCGEKKERKKRFRKVALKDGHG